MVLIKAGVIFVRSYTVEQSKDLVFGPLYSIEDSRANCRGFGVNQNEKLFSDKNATTPLKGDQRAEIGMIFI